MMKILFRIKLKVACRAIDQDCAVLRCAKYNLQDHQQLVVIFSCQICVKFGL